jgi:hypothetical protein
MEPVEQLPARQNTITFRRLTQIKEKQPCICTIHTDGVRHVNNIQ